jgi:hypothetical protein
MWGARASIQHFRTLESVSRFQYSKDNLTLDIRLKRNANFSMIA